MSFSMIDSDTSCHCIHPSTLLTSASVPPGVVSSAQLCADAQAIQGAHGGALAGSHTATATPTAAAAAATATCVDGADDVGAPAGTEVTVRALRLKTTRSLE